ncbi:MAG: hypothetical protein IKH15_09170 [Bacteroidales bacterium]|nr:hypothetical protein [Bacteroidales bacterium]
MTREEIIEAIQNDDMMPFLQDWEARDVVDFVLKNYRPSLPSNLEEAAEDRVTENGRFELTASEKLRIDDIMFGAEWMARQDEVLTTGTVDELCYDCHDRIPELIEKTGLSADNRVELIVRKI